MGKRHWSFYRSELLTNQGLIKNFDKFANRKNKIKLLNKTEYIIETIKKEESYLRSRYFIKHMDLYGSYAKKMQRPESDIDLVYTTIPNGNMTLARLKSFENYLSKLLKIDKVELVSNHSINPIVEINIEKDAISIF